MYEDSTRFVSIANLESHPKGLTYLSKVRTGSTLEEVRDILMDGSIGGRASHYSVRHEILKNFIKEANSLSGMMSGKEKLSYDVGKDDEFFFHLDWNNYDISEGVVPTRLELIMPRKTLIEFRGDFFLLELQSSGSVTLARVTLSPQSGAFPKYRILTQDESILMNAWKTEIDEAFTHAGMKGDSIEEMRTGSLPERLVGSGFKFRVMCFAEESPLFISRDSHPGVEFTLLRGNQLRPDSSFYELRQRTLKSQALKGVHLQSGWLWTVQGEPLLISSEEDADE